MLRRTRCQRCSGGQLRVVLVAVATVLTLTALGFGTLPTSAQSTATAAADACPPATPTSGTSTSNLCVEIGEYDIYFNPNTVTILANTPVRVVLINHGATVHDFTITDHKNPGVQNLNIHVVTNPGQTGETTINAPEGIYYFYCSQPGHEQAGMYGYLTVKKGATISTAEATVTPRAG
jgi:uncharacterized cupredoxin-like copper-binding protein